MHDLLTWYRTEGRHDLPWRKTKDPYKVLVSEIMLQQTQVSRVIPKYRAFLQAFPTLRALANAERKDVLRLWQGLGYNSRAARLHALAKMIPETLPRTYEELLALPGIGPYTAGAIMIFCHDVPAASVDVNVARVLTRLHYGRDERPGRKDVARLQLRLAREADSPRELHSALMDFGSSVCTARKPRCTECPLFARCRSQGERPDERRSTGEKFEGSNRWWRGRILRHTLDGPISRKALYARIGRDGRKTFDRALESLRADGLISVERGFVRIR